MTAKLLDLARPMGLYDFMELLRDLGLPTTWAIRLVLLLDGPICDATMRLRGHGVSGS